jgi:hypothetical protein
MRVLYRKPPPGKLVLLNKNSFINRRFWIAIPLVAGSAYALSRWFFLGLTASKWIGLPQFASAVQELNSESGSWGIAALVLECVAILLILPRKPKRQPSAPLDAHAWFEHLGHCALRTALCCFITVFLVVVYVVLSMATHRPQA